MANNLVLHAGARGVDLAEVAKVPTPAATESWQPLPHLDLVELVQEQIVGLGLTIVEQNFGLARDGARFFGTLGVEGANTGASDFRLSIGVRNSHDKSFPAGLAAGEKVFVCDNLAFHATIVLARKHTSRILLDLPRLVADTLGRLSVVAEDRKLLIGSMKEFEVNNRFAHDFAFRAVDAKVLPITRIPSVIEEWRKPSFDDFKPRTMWSLYNAFTYTMKGYADSEIARRSQRLTGLASLAVKGAMLDEIVSGEVVEEQDES